MKLTHTLNFIVFLLLSSFSWAGQVPPLLISQDKIKKAFGRIEGSFVIITRSTGAMICFNPQGCLEKLPPFSTFKIWNTLFGIETGLITSVDDPFYTWDGETRFIPEWNKDLTFREAFRVSCVPAFRELARKIGEEKMQLWIEKIHYGDCDISLGIDCFWLPKAGEKSILISPLEQAELILSLVSKKLPISPKSLEMLEEVMQINDEEYASLYGKTGSGMDENEKFNLGWFVGYLKRNREIHAFASVVKGPGLTGKDARTVVETIFKNSISGHDDFQ